MDITDLRKEIEEIDTRLIPLFEKRLDVAARIAGYKREHGIPTLDATRESEKLFDISSRCREDLREEISEIFSELMRVCREYQETLREAQNG